MKDFVVQRTIDGVPTDIDISGDRLLTTAEFDGLTPLQQKNYQYNCGHATRVRKFAGKKWQDPVRRLPRGRSDTYFVNARFGPRFFERVSTILKIESNPFINDWKVSQALDIMAKTLIATRRAKKYRGPTFGDIDGAEVLAKRFIRESSALQVGSAVHDLVQGFFDEEHEPEPVPEELQAEVLARFQRFEEWYSAEHVSDDWDVASEFSVWSEDHSYAGTIDLLFDKGDGRFLIVDIKNSKQVWRSHHTQTEAYARAFAEMMKIPADWIETRVLRLGLDEYQYASNPDRLASWLRYQAQLELRKRSVNDEQVLDLPDLH